MKKSITITIETKDGNVFTSVENSGNLNHYEILGILEVMRVRVVTDAMNRNAPKSKAQTEPTEDAELFTVFVNEYLRLENNVSEWVKELNFYSGDLKEVNVADDERFREIKGKRKRGVMLGYCYTKFPVKYPLVITTPNHELITIHEGDYKTLTK